MTCRYRFTCISTVGPIGIHECPHCGAMVRTAQDPEPYCKMPSDTPESTEYIDGQESIQVLRDIVLEERLKNVKIKK